MLFHAFLVVLALTWLYVLLVRLPLYRHVGYNFPVDTLVKFRQRETYLGKVVFGWMITMWLVTTVNNFVPFLY